MTRRALRDAALQTSWRNTAKLKNSFATPHQHLANRALLHPSTLPLRLRTSLQVRIASLLIPCRRLASTTHSPNTGTSMTTAAMQAVPKKSMQSTSTPTKISVSPAWATPKLSYHFPLKRPRSGLVSRRLPSDSPSFHPSHLGIRSTRGTVPRRRRTPTPRMRRHMPAPTASPHKDMPRTMLCPASTPSSCVATGSAFCSGAPLAVSVPPLSFSALPAFSSRRADTDCGLRLMPALSLE